MTAFAHLAPAQRLGALSPTASVQAQPERMAQWLDRLLWARSLAERGRDPAEAVAEANRYSGRPQPPQPWPAPMPRQALAGLFAPLRTVPARPFPSFGANLEAIHPCSPPN